MRQEKIAVIGLGYVGLPVALAFAKAFPGTIGFDVNARKVDLLRQGIDETGEISAEMLKLSGLEITASPNDLTDISFFVIAVPTPVDSNNKPDFGALIGASEVVGSVLRTNAVVVYESTVYPGVTEEICGPVLERVSGLKRSTDFTLGYSPERINPGDKEHTLERIVKVVAGEDAETLERVAVVYEKIITAGVHRTSSIKVAEAAKVIENSQRDLNIAFMNELALIFDRMGISTRDVLEAAGTKWNFLKFYPGLVGGHCIGVDPYYLTTKAEQLGYTPQVILAGRRINDGMGSYIAQRVVKLMVHADIPIKGARVGVLGLTFKENVTDLRNSRVPDIINELKQFGVSAVVHDPYALARESHEEYGLTLCGWDVLRDLDALIVAVAHQVFLEKDITEITDKLRPGGVLVDVKSIFQRKQVRGDITYWSL